MLTFVQYHWKAYHKDQADSMLMREMRLIDWVSQQTIYLDVRTVRQHEYRLPFTTCPVAVGGDLTEGKFVLLYVKTKNENWC